MKKIWLITLVIVAVITTALLSRCNKFKNPEMEISLSLIGKARELSCDSGYVYQLDFLSLKFPSVDPGSDPELFEDQKSIALEFVDEMNKAGLEEGGRRHVHRIDPSGTWHIVFICTPMSESEVTKIAALVRDQRE